MHITVPASVQKGALSLPTEQCLGRELSLEEPRELQRVSTAQKLVNCHGLSGIHLPSNRTLEKGREPCSEASLKAKVGAGQGEWAEEGSGRRACMRHLRL